MSESKYHNSDDSDNETEKFMRFEENVSEKLQNLIIWINKNKNISQAKQKAIIQKKMKISQKLQDFQVKCTIKFASKNMQIHVNSKKIEITKNHQ